MEWADVIVVTVMQRVVSVALYWEVIWVGVGCAGRTDALVSVWTHAYTSKYECGGVESANIEI